MKCINRVSVTVLYLFTTMNSSVALASGDDDYLKLLESEAVNTRVDQGFNQNKQPENSISNAAARDFVNKKWDGECDYGDAVQSDIVEDEFYSFLKQCAMGTFIYYKQLNYKSKHSVYKNYRLSAPMRLKTLRRNILSYF